MKLRLLYAVVILCFLTNDGKALDRHTIDLMNCRCYDNKADLWDRFPFKEIIPHWIFLYSDKKLPKTALDIGSGTGTVSLWLKNQGYEVTCLDPSLEMVKRTTELGLETYQTTIQDYHISRQFSLVLGLLSLIHVPRNELPQQIHKIHGLLHPNGLFILAMIEGQGETIREDPPGYPRFFAEYSENEIQNLLRIEGFEMLDIQRISNPNITYLLFIFRSVS